MARGGRGNDESNTFHRYTASPARSETVGGLRRSLRRRLLAEGCGRRQHASVGAPLAGPDRGTKCGLMYSQTRGLLCRQLEEATERLSPAADSSGVLPFGRRLAWRCPGSRSRIGGRLLDTNKTISFRGHLHPSRKRAKGGRGVSTRWGAVVEKIRGSILAAVVRR